MPDCSWRHVVGSPRHQDLRADDVYGHGRTRLRCKYVDRLVGGFHRFFCFIAEALAGVAASFVALPLWRSALTLGRGRLRMIAVHVY